MADNAIVESKASSPVENKRMIKYRLFPTYYLNMNSENNEFELEVHLPGVRKDKINIKFLEDMFNIEAEQSDTRYYCLTESLPFLVNVNSIKANYDNGLLRIIGSVKNPLDEAVDVKIE
jgi:HSP20 family molecular chaperone IbpA